MTVVREAAIIRTLLLIATIGWVTVVSSNAQSPAEREGPPAAETTALEIPDTLVGPAASAATSQVTSFAAAQSTYRPYRQEPSVYLSAPAVRYNRVEGVVVGLQKDPLGWTGTPEIAPFGQVGYSFGLREWRAVVGLEARLISPPTQDRGYGLKIGAHAAQTTATQDDWKRSWEENSVSALLFGQDLFTYYDLRAFTAYAVQRISRQLQLTIGARWADHAQLGRTTTWALLSGHRPGPNPRVDAGELRSALLTLEGGRLARLSERRSVGTIARFHAEFGQGFGAPLAYNRYILDVQTYRAVAPKVNLNLRGRAGVATEDAPVQMQFRLDGVRGLRTFEPAARAEERMLLGSAAWVWHDVPHTGWSGPTQLRAFGDVGWFGDRAPPEGETFSFVGVGASAFDRVLSIELAWPLHGTPNRPHSDSRPQVALKINPLR